ncbi:MAG: FAD-binding protein, partial [Alphaproteobacteria bacterium]
MNNIECDVVIVGTGIAGLSCALSFDQHTNIIIVSDNLPGKSGSTMFAQGGIAFSENNDESINNHICDTVNAGAGMCDENVVNHFIRNSSETINWLQEQGIIFDTNNDGNMSKGREGGHTDSRIAHIGGDATGKGIIEALFKKVSSQDNITFIKGEISALLQDDNNVVCGIETQGFTINTSSVVLATGGGCGIFSSRTAPAQPLSAFELAMQAGSEATDMEFFQYHPTALDLPVEITAQIPRLPLISEAIRGAGAKLIVGKDEKLEINHPMNELAPRDVVSRAVFKTRQTGKRVYLDTSSIEKFSTRFPTIANICKQYDVNYNKIPIRTAVHYQIGGIKTDVNGATCVDGLYV